MYHISFDILTENQPNTLLKHVLIIFTCIQHIYRVEKVISIQIPRTEDTVWMTDEGVNCTIESKIT